MCVCGVRGGWGLGDGGTGGEGSSGEVVAVDGVEKKEKNVARMQV